jgi:hypothetical protein
LDDLGTTLFNQRPAFLPAGANIAACSGRVLAGSAPCVEHGFVLNPTPGMTIIPVNYGKAFPQYNVNLRISKTWGFGELTQAARNRQQQQDAGGGRGPGFGQAAGGGGRGGGGGGGPRGGGGGMPGMGGDSSGRRYSLTASIMFHNMFNTVNPAAPIGNLLSPSYGEAIAQVSGGAFGGAGAAQAFNRRIDLSLRFTF